MHAIYYKQYISTRRRTHFYLRLMTNVLIACYSDLSILIFQTHFVLYCLVGAWRWFSGQQSKLSRLGSNPNFKCTLRLIPSIEAPGHFCSEGRFCGKLDLKMKMANPNLKTMEWPLSRSSRNGCSHFFVRRLFICSFR